MFKLDDLLSILDRWNEWKSIKATPKRVDELDKRLTAIEAQLSTNPLGERCSECGTQDVEIAGHRRSRGPFGRQGVRDYLYKCLKEGCGKETWVTERID